MKRCDLDYHVVNNCPENQIQCDVCDDNLIKRKDMKNHLKNFCSENTI